MFSTVTSNLAVAAGGAGSRSAKLDELSKQARMLRQQMTQVQKEGTNPASGVKSGSRPADDARAGDGATGGAGASAPGGGASSPTTLAEELVTIQAQIERLALESQLSRLTSEGAGDAATDSHAHDPDSDGGSAPTSRKGGPAPQGAGTRHAGRSPNPYNVAPALVGRLVNALA